LRASRIAIDVFGCREAPLLRESQDFSAKAIRAKESIP
jgi:hypothetical protein